MISGGGGLAALQMLFASRSGSSLAGAANALDSTPKPTDLQMVKRTSWALGSDVSMVVLHERQDAAEKAISAAFDELKRVDEIMSLYRPQSEVCRLNREGTLDHPHPCLVEILRKAQAMSERSGGAFDATVQPLWELYAAAKKAGKLPDAAAIEAARNKVDWRKVEVSPGQIRLKGKGMAVTLNGIAQGYAADRALLALREHGIKQALANTGEVGALGRKENGQPWTIGIQHPRHADAYIALAKLEDRCMATSGDYATTFSSDHIYHHIFDPATGRSPEVFSSVSVIAPAGVDADALSTAVFVLGLEKGLPLVLSSPQAEAFFVLKDGKTLATKGFPKAS